ncbi:MAG TPA: porphobilinogen synthase [Parachlamydiaceae bacterium]|nr:porphobilinogen synthase [Parachlamydiaceae bacterium]
MTSLFAEKEALDLLKRPRRNRKSLAMRALVQETRLHPNHLVAPLFILEGENQSQEIASMPGCFRLSVDLALKEAENLLKQGVLAVDLFPVVPQNKKDAFGSYSLDENNLLKQAVFALKQTFPELLVMADVALDPFTDHGHDGLINEDGNILNDETVKTLLKMSLILADAGADVIAPSDMMDGRVKFLRQGLDESGFLNTSILAYAAKYASSFYGPFREALHSAPKFGDKKTYQMNPANSREALLECALDEEEGADMLLIKPALPYLDILAKLKKQTLLPIGAYQVSGEYSMIMAAGNNGWINSEKVLYESLISIKRAGADFILTYAANRISAIMKNEN